MWKPGSPPVLVIGAEGHALTVTMSTTDGRSYDDIHHTVDRRQALSVGYMRLIRR